MQGRRPGPARPEYAGLSVSESAMPTEAEVAGEEVARLVRESRGILSDAPRKGRTALTSDREYDRYGEPVDHITGGQPRRGGVVHPEVERLAREHALYFNDPNTVYPVPSAAERERQQRRATNRRGLFTIQELHRQALRSAAGSRG